MGIFVNMGIGGRILELRGKAGLTREALAGMVELTPQSIMNYENEVRDPKSNDLIAIAKALKTTAAYLLGETDNPSPNILRAMKDYTEEVHRIRTEPFTGFKIDKEAASKMTREEIEEAKRITERNIVKIELEEAKEVLIKRLQELSREG